MFTGSTDFYLIYSVDKLTRLKNYYKMFRSPGKINLQTVNQENYYNEK